jgi:cell division protein FtsW
MNEDRDEIQLDRGVFGDEGIGKESILAKWWVSVDTVSIAAVAALCLIGLLLGMASSAGLAERHNLGDFYFVKKQAFFCGLSVAVMIGISMMPLTVLSRGSFVAMIFVLGMICFLPFFGTDFGKGAIRWFSVGGMSVQPSEFFKPFFAVAAGLMLAKASHHRVVSGVHGSACLMVFVVTILALQPDYGQAGLIFSAWILMYLASGSALLGMFMLGGLAVFGGVVAYTKSEHVARRINSFMSQDVSPTEQIGYSIRAIENGGMFGAGIGEGTVKFSLPDAHTDFIVAVAAEEYGFVMVVALLSLYMTILLRSFVRLMLETDHMKRVVGSGLVGLIGLQALINIGVSVKFFPAKGMTLPFVSYGGSSAVAVGITAGMLLAFTRRAPKQQ